MSLSIEADMDRKLAILLSYKAEHPNIVSVGLQVFSYLEGMHRHYVSDDRPTPQGTSL